MIENNQNSRNNRNNDNFPSSLSNSTKEFITQAIKQQYFNAESFGIIKSKSAHQFEPHQPIPINNLLHMINNHIKYHRSQSLDHVNEKQPILSSPSFPSSSSFSPSVAAATTTKARQTMKELDGFYLLDISHLDFPDNLATVNISSRELGSIVEEDLTFFSSLQYLDASDNNLSLPPFRVLPSLRELRLACNDIREIREEDICEGFDQLMVLDVGYNHLTDDSIQNLCVIQSLRQLDISGNNLSTLPSDMFRFSDLDKLILTHNKFTDDKIFIILSYIPKIRIINLAYNYLSKVFHEACESNDQFKWLETLDLSFNYFSEEENLMPILQPKKIKELIIYGNPLLGPTGDDPNQVYIENLVDASLLPSKLGRQHAVEIITDIPRDRPSKKGQLQGRQVKYRDFIITKVHNDHMKLNREWRQEGNRSIFAETMSLIKKQQSNSESFISLSSIGDVFFITEVETKQIDQLTQQAASKVMDKIAIEIGLDDTTDLDELEKHIQVHPVMASAVSDELAKEEYDRNLHHQNYSHNHDNSNSSSNPILPPIVSLNKNNWSDDVRVIKNSNGYDMPLKTAIQALKFAVNHPLTNYYEVPAKGFLPPWSYVQPNESYKNRKVSKYIPSESNPPIIVSTNPSSSFRKYSMNNFPQPIVSTKGSSTIQQVGKSILKSSRSSKSSGKLDKKDKERLNVIRNQSYDQLDEVLTDLNRYTDELTSKPPGHGQNLKENIEALKSFVRPQTALHGLATMVGNVLYELDK